MNREFCGQIPCQPTPSGIEICLRQKSPENGNFSVCGGDFRRFSPPKLQFRSPGESVSPYANTRRLQGFSRKDWNTIKR